MILSCSHIEKSFGENVVLSDCSFFLNEGEKAAIVGNNGAGKSTLLKIILGEISPDNGTVSISKDIDIGYLSQYQDLNLSNTIYEEARAVRSDLVDIENRLNMLQKEMEEQSSDDPEKTVEKYATLEQEYKNLGGYSYRGEIEGALKGMGFDLEYAKRPIGTLSGGQKTRVSLCKLLLKHPDLIILDEPTNHLDLSSIKWLEKYLSGYKGSVLLVAHDRYFLDKIVTKVISLEHGKCRVYDGNYSAFYEKHKKLMLEEMNLYLKQQRDIQHQEEVIEKLRSYNREKFYKRAESRQKTLDNMSVLKKPDAEDKSINFSIDPQKQSGKDVLNVEGLSKSFGNLNLFAGVSFSIQRGEKTALIGDNGTGKTTILKIINNQINPNQGTVKLGTNVNIGYYDQEQQTLNNELTLFDELLESSPTSGNTRIRNILAAFMFTKDEVFKKVNTLSGGEKARLSLAKLVLSGANFLILDEPTNHLDMSSREVLEDALNRYSGTILYVSHDRYFINQTASKIIELNNQKITQYLGNYDYYEEKKTQNNAATYETSGIKASQKSEGAINYQKKKEEEARIRKIKSRLEKVESEISTKERLLDELADMMEDPSIATNAARLSEISKEKDECEKKIESLMEQWESLSLELK